MDDNAKVRIDNALISYYSMDDPIMSDEEFDTLFTKVYPERQPFDVYSELFVGRGRRRSLKKPMLSLEKANSRDKMIAWIESIQDNGYSYITLVPKYDGAAALIETGSQGEIVSATTRGDGSVGQDITYVVSHIPLDEPLQPDSLIQAEIVLHNDDIDEANEFSINHGGKEYSSPRNIASGLLRRTGSSAKQGASFLRMRPHFSSQRHSYTFPIEYMLDSSDIVQIFDDFHNNVLNNLDCDTDGIVIYVSNEEGGPYTELGNKEKTPKWSISWKFPDEPVEAILEDVQWKHNRTQKTPVAIFQKPVTIENSSVSRATLHNMDFIRDMDIHIGDTLHVVLANKIIPKIVDVIPAESPQRKEITLPDDSSKALSDFHIYDSYAKNVLGSLDIDFAGDSARQHLVKYCLSVYPLERHPVISIFKGMKDMTYKDTLRAIPSFSTQSHSGESRKIKTSIRTFSNSIKNTFDQKKSTVQPQDALQSLSIPSIGKVNARNILSTMTVKELIVLSEHKDLPEIKNIGNKTKDNIYKNSFLINTIFSLFFPWLVEKNAPKEKNHSRKVVITGKFNKPRKEIEKILNDNGYELSNTVSQEINYVITPDSSSQSQKNIKAKKLGIDIIEVNSVEQFFNRQ